MNLFGMGPMEIAVILIVALVIFGPGKLPEIGGQVGRAVRDFRRATRDLTAEFQDSIDDVQSTIGEMKATVTDVRNETAALAATIPASLDISQPAAGAAGSQVAATNGAAAAVATAEPAATASKDDPLADLAGLDDDVLAAGSEKPA
jgi:TatA/E family protein of Tat protein translocase